MSRSDDLRRRAADLPASDVVAVLVRQHDQVRGMFEDVLAAEGQDREHLFDRLRAFLAVHETAEEMVLRPVTAQVDEAVARARNEEEAEANVLLAELEHLDATGPEFEQRLRRFQQVVADHAEAEEREELPQVLESCDDAKRTVMGRALLAAEAVAPTHPHPSTAGSPAAQWALGPVVSLVDRTRDAVRAALRR